MGNVLFLDPCSVSRVAVQTAASVIREGGVVLSPTDTVYGLACDPRRSRAINRIREVKGRSSKKGFLLLIPGPESVSSLVDVPISDDFRQMRQLWPGPVTFLFAAGSDAPRAAVGSGRKIGLRCPEDQFLQAWLRALDHPLLSTSANRSGEDIPQSTEGLRELFGNSVDLLLFRSEETESQASTVVDLTASPPAIVRRGDQAHRVDKVLRLSS